MSSAAALPSLDLQGLFGSAPGSANINTRRGSLTDPVMHAHSAPGPSSAPSSAPSSVGMEARPSMTSLGPSPAYGYSRRDSPEYPGLRYKSVSGDQRESVPPSAGFSEYGFPPSANHLGKRKMDEAPQMEDEAITPLAHPQQDPYSMAWHKRRSSAFSDGGARFGAMNLNGRRDSMASSESDPRRGSLASTSSGYSSSYSAESYPYPAVSSSSFGYPASLASATLPGGQIYGQPAAMRQLAPDHFNSYGFPQDNRSPMGGGDDSLPPVPTFDQQEHSPHSTQSPFHSEPDPAEAQKVFPPPSSESSEFEPSPTILGSPSIPTSAGSSGKKETPYSRSPEMRVSHKMAERKRRKEMKELFDELRELLPVERGMKASKWETLSAACEHLRHMDAAAAMDRQRIFELESMLSRVQQPMAPAAYPSPQGPYIGLPAAPMGQALSVAHPHSHLEMMGQVDEPPRPPWPQPPRQMTM